MNDPLVDLSDRRIVIVGAAGGLGMGCVRSVRDLGAEVVGVDLSIDPGRAELPGIKWLEADTTDEDAVAASLERAAELMGGLDGLVSASGIISNVAIENLSADEWRRVLDVNLTGAFLQVREAATRMSGKGSMVLFSSVAGRGGRAMAAHYAASKAGVISLTRSAAARYAPDIRVNAVCPGQFMTPMWDRIMRDRDTQEGPGAGKRWRDAVHESIPLKRAGEISELATVVSFLLSSAAGYITGQAINVDGGLEMD